MDLPQALREEHNPRAFEGLLVLLRSTTYRCPHCRGALRRDFWPNDVKLGSGKHICRKCGTVFDDGSHEWPELSLAKRLRFLFATLLIGISGGFVVAAILSILITPWEEHRWLVILIVLGFSLIPIIVWCPIRPVCVRGSKNRYETELPSMRTRLETDRLS